MSKRPLQVVLASPRGCCAGVERAILTVERVIAKFGTPVYVRHEIVHNKFVVDRLYRLGARFIEDFAEIKDSSRPVIISAHGAAKSVFAAAGKKNLHLIDATCPLVNKVHREAEAFYRYGCHVVLIGHKNHPEVIGTLGQLPAGAIDIIETADDAVNYQLPKHQPLACITQTTLSVHDTAGIIAVLKQRFPDLRQPKSEDICFATSNRQQAVQQLAKQVELILVIGAGNSSNSLRLVEVAKANNCPAYLTRDSNDIPWQLLPQINSLGITASASAPEILVQEMITALRQRFDLTVEDQKMSAKVRKEESIYFKAPMLEKSSRKTIGTAATATGRTTV